VAYAIADIREKQNAVRETYRKMIAAQERARQARSTVSQRKGPQAGVMHGRVALDFLYPGGYVVRYEVYVCTRVHAVAAGATVRPTGVVTGYQNKQGNIQWISHGTQVRTRHTNFCN
jgi:hypothetical protein